MSKGTCVLCHKNKTLVKDNNDIIDGYGFCRTCINNIADFNDNDSICEICRYLNIPFVINVVEDIKNNETQTWGEYARRINLLKNINTYNDSIFTIESEEDNDNQDKSTDTVVTNDMRLRWGTSYTDEQIEELEYSLKNLYAIKQPLTEIEKERYRMNCQLKLTLNEAYRAGDVKSIPNLRKAYEDDSKAIGLEAVLNTKENEVESIGERIKGWERTKPVPQYKELDDVNFIKKYIKRWFRTPLKRDFGIASEQEISELYEDE